MTSINYDFLGAEFKNMEVKVGNILISEPFLMDDNFSRSVILITEHNNAGSFGLVLNKPLGRNLSDVVDGFESSPIPLFVGGPVDRNTLHVVHSIGDEVPGSIKIADNLFWGGDFGYLKTMSRDLRLDAHSVKFFIGYAGWVADQLNEEILAKSWVVASLGIVDIFNLPPDEMWSACVESLGGKFKEWLNFPVDPSLN